MSKFNRLVAYGCSYTTAAETIDEEWYPGADEIKSKHGMHYFYDLLTQKYKNFDFFEYDNASKKNSWANQLANNLKIPCQNNAVSGNSFHKMYWELSRDLSAGSIKDNDLIFIGITSPERVVYFADYGAQALHLAYPDRWPEEIKNNVKPIVNFFSSEQLKFQFLVTLEAFIGKAEGQLKDRLYFVECDPRALYTDYEKVDPSMSPHPKWFTDVVADPYSKFKQSPYLVSKHGMYFNMPKEELHAGQHITKESHKKWADHIYDEFMMLTSK